MNDLMDVGLPESVQSMLDENTQPDRDQLHATIQALTTVLIDRRSRYTQGRALAGIEDIWRKAEDNYACIDASTGVQSAVYRPRYTKAQTPDGPITRNDAPSQLSSKANVFERLTARYVDAGHAKICEIVLARNAKSFSLDATPDPDLMKSKQDLQQVMAGGQPLERDPRPDELVPPDPTNPLAQPAMNPDQPPASMPGKPLTVKDIADERIAQAHAAAKKMEQIIYDWMIEGHWRKHMKSVLHYASKLGVGILKGPFPEMRKGRVVTQETNDKGDTTIVLQIQEKLKPGFRCVPPWDFFPDPDCGNDIQNGQGVFERGYLSERQLEALKKIPGYFEEHVNQVIGEGPGKKYLATDNQHTQMRFKDERYEAWYHTGWLTQIEVKALNQYMRLPQDKQSQQLPETPEKVSCVVTLVNDVIIHCAINGLEQSGDLPYRTVAWTPREGSWDGVGVAEQVFYPQDLINAASNAMVNNAGVSCGSQIIMQRGVVEPAGKNKNDYTIHGDKLWWMSPDAAIDDVRKVFAVFQIPNVTPQMLSIIMHAYRVAENSSNIPLISQGQSGPTTPETFGGQQLQNNNANQLLRAVGGTVDTDVTEPLVENLYEWGMLDPSVPNEAKGDFQTSANGSSALVEQYIQDQFILQEAQFVKDPAFGINPKKWYADLRRSRHLDPKDVQYTEEEQAKLAQVPPPKPPQVQAAEIRAQVDIQKAKMDTDRDTAYVNVENQRTQIDHDAKMAELNLRLQLAQLDYANKRQISLEQVKSEIAQTTMKLAVTKELAAHNRVQSDQAIAPAIEPSGKAETGHAFEQ